MRGSIVGQSYIDAGLAAKELAEQRPIEIGPKLAWLMALVLSLCDVSGAKIRIWQRG